MKTILKKRARVLAGVLAASFACSSVSALSFSFSQGGFSEGATVTGSFSGVDGDSDGYLSYLPFDGLFELSSFSLSFSGNSLVSAFTLGLADLEQFSFKLGGDAIVGNDYSVDPLAPFATTEVIIASNSDYVFTVGDLISYLGSPIIESASTYDLLDSSIENPTSLDKPISTAVPDSGSTAALFGVAALSLFALRRRAEKSCR